MSTLPLCSPAHYHSDTHIPLEVLTHYVIVRSDLPRGVQAANIVHAAGESSPGNLPSGTHAIVLVVPNETELRTILARLTLAKIKFCPIIEPDAPYYNALMAIGINPDKKEILRKYLSSLPLLK